MPYADPIERKEYLKKYYLAHADLKKSRALKTYLENREELDKKHRQWRLNHPEYGRLYKRKTKIQNPEKYFARQAVSTALRNGSLKRQPCVICANDKSQAHHEDYSKPLIVTWLCSKHHSQKHRRKYE